MLSYTCSCGLRNHWNEGPAPKCRRCKTVPTSDELDAIGDRLSMAREADRNRFNELTDVGPASSFDLSGDPAGT